MSALGGASFGATGGEVTMVSMSGSVTLCALGLGSWSMAKLLVQQRMVRSQVGQEDKNVNLDWIRC